MSDKKTNLSRRAFLGRTAALAAAPYIVPASVFGRDGAVPPSERIVLGGIGIGNRGTHDLQWMLPEKDVQFVADCDPQKQRREAVKKLVDTRYGNSDFKLYSDIREFLATRTDIVPVAYKGTAPEERKVTDAFVRRRLHSLDWVLRTWINQPGVAFFYEGTTVAAEKPAEQVTVTSAKNDSVTLYIDQNTYLPIKTSYSFRDPEDKQRSVEEELFDDYKPVQGIMTPRSVTRYFNGDMSAQRFVTTTTYNGEFPADIFSATVTYDPYKSQSKNK